MDVYQVSHVLLLHGNILWHLCVRVCGLLSGRRLVIVQTGGLQVLLKLNNPIQLQSNNREVH